MGANPHASQGSFLACPDVLGELDGIRARGGKIVVDRPAPHRHRRARRRVDPDRPRHRRRVPARDGPRPVRRGPRRPRRRRRHRRRRRASCRRSWPTSRPRPSRRTCEIPAETIRRIAREIAAAPTAAVYGRIGLCNQEFGTLASWLVDVVNIAHRQLRPAGRHDVRQPDRVVVGAPPEPRPRRRRRVRALAQPRPRRARGARPGAGVVPGRGDRHPGRRARSRRSDHHRRQPGASARPTPDGSTPRCPSSSA